MSPGAAGGILKRPVALETDGVLEKPEADLGVAVDGETAGAKVDDLVACPGTNDGRVEGGEGLDEVVLVRNTTVFPRPLGDVQLVLGAATGEDACW